MFVTKAKKKKQLLFNNETKQKPSFRKRAWHSCTTFAHPPDPLERKEDLREDTESQYLFPARRERRKMKQNSRGRRVGKTVIRLHINEHINTHAQTLTHKCANANTCARTNEYAHSYYYPKKSINRHRLQPEADGCYLHSVRPAVVTNKNVPPCYLH